ncbi:MAG: site-2 protease family protein [Chloroflexota bacterium]|nr:site-2 protease family protein [Chloroflexota bacterium]
MCASPLPDSRGRSRITPLQWVGLAVLVLLLANQVGLLRLNSPGAISEFLEAALPRFVALVLAITVHEFSHGLVATLFGDDLPRRVGRLTLNPLKHLDPLGTLMILIGPIGWGRPMPINPGAMRLPNLGWALSSLAGPVSNLIAAALTATLLGLAGSALSDAADYLKAFITINVLLALFNLIPLPPLDGFGFVFGLAPRALKLALMPLQSYGPLILLAVLFLPPLRPIIDQFIFGGLRVLLPPLRALCQCNPIA